MRRITSLTSELLWSVPRCDTVDFNYESALSQANLLIGPHLLEGACRRQWLYPMVHVPNLLQIAFTIRDLSGPVARKQPRSEARALDQSFSDSALSQPDTALLLKAPKHGRHVIHGLLTPLDPDPYALPHDSGPTKRSPVQRRGKPPTAHAVWHGTKSYARSRHTRDGLTKGRSGYPDIASPGLGCGNYGLQRS